MTIVLGRATGTAIAVEAVGAAGRGYGRVEGIRGKKRTMEQMCKSTQVKRMSTSRGIGRCKMWIWWEIENECECEDE